MDHFNVSFDLLFASSAVQVQEFNRMECEDYENTSDISLIELQNVSASEIMLESADDQCNQIEISEDSLPLPSYGSFVKNLNGVKNESFESLTNSTRVEDAFEMSANNMNECANDCTCEMCTPTFDQIIQTEDLDSNVIILEDITVNNLYYHDFSNMINKTECTTYMNLPQGLCASSSVSSGTVKQLLRNKILAKFNKEANATGVYDITSS